MASPVRSPSKSRVPADLNDMSTPKRGKTTPVSNAGSYAPYAHGTPDIDLGSDPAPSTSRDTHPEPTLRERLETIANPPLRKPTADQVKVGHCLDDGRLVTKVEHDDNRVSIWLDGHPHGAEVALSAAGRVTIIDKPPIDFSDPDEFEDQVYQIADREVGNHLPDGPILEEWKQMRADKAGGLSSGMGLSRKDWAAYHQIRGIVEKEVRFDLHRASQGEHATSVGLDDPRVANGRAKVGDDVIDSANGEAYRVISRQPVQVIGRLPGEDGLPVTALAEWKDDPTHIQYTLKSLRTGERLIADLRHHAWKRIPAPAPARPTEGTSGVES